MSDYKNRLKALNDERGNGNPVMEDREKGKFEDLTGEVLTMKEAAPLDKYFAVNFEEYPDLFFFSNSALTSILTDAAKMAEEDNVSIDSIIGGVKIKILDPVKTSKGFNFRPVEILD